METTNRNIGRKVILWNLQHRTDAYTDQLGVQHSADVVLEEIEVTIAETKRVPNAWGRGHGEGWKGLDDTGREFFCNWESFPDDSMAPSFSWSSPSTSGQLVDAGQAYRLNPNGNIRTDGSRAIPPTGVAAS